MPVMRECAWVCVYVIVVRPMLFRFYISLRVHKISGRTMAHRSDEREGGRRDLQTIGLF